MYLLTRSVAAVAVAGRGRQAKLAPGNLTLRDGLMEQSPGAHLCAEVVALRGEADEQLHEAREHGVLHGGGQAADVGRDVKDAAAYAPLLGPRRRRGKVKRGAAQLHDAGVRCEVAQQRRQDVQVLAEQPLRLGVRLPALQGTSLPMSATRVADSVMLGGIYPS